MEEYTKYRTGNEEHEKDGRFTPPSIFRYEHYEACLNALRNIDSWIKSTGTRLPYIEYELKNVEDILKE